MTVSSNVSRIEEVGDGIKTSFVYNFRIFADADLKVFVAGVLKVLPTDYTVTGAGDVGGGNVVFVTAPASVASIVILRNLPASQPIDLVAQGPIPAETLEKAYDRAIMLVQQLEEFERRILAFKESSLLKDPILPDGVANQLLRWKTPTELENVDKNDLNLTLSEKNILAGFTKAGLPAAGTAGRLARVTDDVGGVWMDQGSQFFSLSGERVNVIEKGAVGDGTTDDLPAIQAAVDVIASNGRGVLIFPAGHSYFTSDEIQLRASNLTVILYGARILGPVAGTAQGALMTVVDRATPAASFTNVSILGGLFEPQNAADNGIGIVSGRRILIDGQTVNLTTGLRAVTIQPDGTAPAPRVQHITVTNLRVFGGGTNAVTVESDGLTADDATDFTISDIISDGSSETIRITSGGDTVFFRRFALSNITIRNAATGITWSRLRESSLSNITMSGITVNGINARLADDTVIGNIQIAGTAGNGMVFANGARVSVQNFIINGTFLQGINVGMDDMSIGPGLIRNATTGIVTAGATSRTVYIGIGFEGVTNNFNTFRGEDEHYGLYTRSGTTTAGLRMDIPVVATASLPAAGGANDGQIVIEDAAVGDRNIIIYAGGQRFRIDGGAGF